MVSHHFAKFSGRKPCGRRDTATKIFYVTLQDHVIKGSVVFMESNSWLHIPTLSILTAIDIVLIDI